MTVKTNSRQKAIFLIIAVFALFGLAFPANAITSQEIINQITALQAKITALQQQLAQIQGQTTQWCHNFNANLGYGDTNSEVGALLVALEKEGLYEIVDINPVRRFDEMIASAVSGFQQKYASEILTPWRLKYGTGFVGVSTRAKLNKLYGCGLPSTTSLTPIVEYPNGGETLVKGQSYEVRWQHAQVLAGKNVNISVHFVGPGEPYSIGSADRWGKDHLIYGPTTVGITTFVPSKGSISWIVPQSVNDGQYKIYVEEFDPITGENHVDLSDTAFTITAPSVTTSITVLSPNGGEQWRVGNTYQIKWRVSGLDKVKILLESSRDQITYKVLSLASSVNAADGVYSWTIPEKTQINSLQDSPYLYEYPYHKIEVVDDRYDYNSTVSKKYSDESDYDFTIVSPATVTSCNTLGTVMYTNPDGTGYIGCDIKAYGDFVLANSYCQGQTTLRKAYLVPDSYGRANQYFATLTGLNVNEEVKVFIGLKDGSQLECLPSLNKNVPSITVLSPNGGEQWVGGQTYPIRWKTWKTYDDSLPTKVLIQLIDERGQYPDSYVIASQIRTLSGEYLWNVPKVLDTKVPSGEVGIGDKYKVQITTLGASYYDKSDDYFSIVSPATVTSCNTLGTVMYTNPDGTGYIGCDIKAYGDFVLANSYCQGQTTLRKAYLVPDSYGRANQYFATLTGLNVNEEVKVFIGLKDGSQLECLPSLNKNVPSITVLSPNGGEQWEVGKTYNIVWESSNLTSTDKILVSIVGSGGEQHLAYNLAGNLGTYTWTVPSNFTVGSYKIKVEGCKSTGQCRSDQSDNYFTIVSAGAFSNLSADLQENKASFSFSYSGTTNEFLIDMSILPDMSWGNYVNFTWASQSPVTHNDPQNRWDQYRCGKTLYWRVYSSDRNKQSSIQTATVNCQPAPSITVLSPNGGEVLYENVNYIIKWNTLGLPSTARILLTLLRNDGKNIDIINGLPAAQQEYVWKVTTAGQWQDGLGYKNKPSLLARLLGIQEAKAAGIGYKIMVTASYENGYLASDSSDNYFSINSTGSETRDLIRQADLRQISSAMELYYGDHDAYVTGETMPTAIPPYMAKVYTDPKSNSSYGWVNNTGDDQKFCVYTALETGCASGQIGYFTSSHKGTTTVACAATAPTWTLACP